MAFVVKSATLRNPDNRLSKKYLIALSGLVLALCISCAGKMKSLLPQIITLPMAVTYLGEPSRSATHDDGSNTHEWIVDNTVFEPGQYVTQQIYVGHDSDGYRKYVEREVWIPAHRRGEYCRVQITTTVDGRVLHSHWEGNVCDRLIRQAAL